MLGQIFRWFATIYACGLGAGVAYWVYLHHPKVWIAWPVVWGAVIALAYLLKKPEDLGFGMFVSKLLTILIGVPIAVMLPLYPSTIRVPFMVLLALSAVFAAALFKDDLQLEFYALLDKMKRWRQGRASKKSDKS